MDWCSYFRLRDGLQFGHVNQALALEAQAAGYTAYAELIQNIGTATIRTIGYYKLSRPTDPEWLTFLGAVTTQSLKTAIASRGHSAVVLVELEGHQYILAFGTGHTLAKKMEIERRFGKVVVGNGKHPDQVRAIQGKVHGTAGKTRTEKRGRGGQLGELELPRRANMASRIAAQLTFAGTKHVADGDRSIRTVAPVGIPDLVTNLRQLEAWWSGGQESDPALAALDRVVDIRHDRQLLAILENQRVSDLLNGSHSKFSLCLDDDDLWEATQIYYIVNRQRYTLTQLDEAYILGALTNLPNGVSPLDVRYDAVIPSRSTHVQGRLFDNLAFETQLPNQPDIYCYEAGGWYSAKSQWKQIVDQDIATLMAGSTSLQNVIPLPLSSPGETEDSYVSRVMSGPLGGRGHQMHLVQRPAGIPDCEPYDICVDGNILLYIKRGSDRSSCGDVTQQVRDAINALTNYDASFLAWSNGHIAAKNWHLDMQHRSQITMCVVLMTGNPNRVPASYAIRAKDALSNHLREVRAQGFQPALIIV